MISFSKLGTYGRLGNQLFQYAFLRETARRLDTKFFCPKWVGDDIFNLIDGNERASEPTGIMQHYDPYPKAGFIPEALNIKNHTDIQGYFQSEKYYSDKQLVRSWYEFRSENITEVDKRYGDLFHDNCISLSLRIDSDYRNNRDYFPLYPLSYYIKALDVITPKEAVLVFSDRPDLARDFFGTQQSNKLIFVNDLTGPQQLYAMTQCRANVITNSTFAWWGAWLNKHPEKIVVAPRYWNRPGVTNTIEDIICEDWVKVSSIHPVLDHLHVWRMRHPVTTIKQLINRKARV